MRNYIVNCPFLQIHLFCGDQLLGSCDVPVDVLTRQLSDSSYTQPVSISDFYAVSSRIFHFIFDSSFYIGSIVILTCDVR